MKASELIKILQELVEEHGDKDVTDNEGYDVQKVKDEYGTYAIYS